jgi:hypothetical protein
MSDYDAGNKVDLLKEQNRLTLAGRKIAIVKM